MYMIYFQELGHLPTILHSPICTQTKRAANTCYIFPRVILYTSFLFLLLYEGFLIGVFRLGTWDWGFLLVGFGACGGMGFFGVGALHINMEE